MDPLTPSAPTDRNAFLLPGGPNAAYISQHVACAPVVCITVLR